MLMYAGGSLVYGRVSQMEASRRFDRDVFAVTGHPDLAEGDLIGRLEVPRLRISVMVLQGVEDRTLVAGAGHVPGTPSPGSDGNVVIAAHRDTFFRTLERVVPGDRIQIDTATWRHVQRPGEGDVLAIHQHFVAAGRGVNLNRLERSQVIGHEGICRSARLEDETLSGPDKAGGASYRGCKTSNSESSPVSVSVVSGLDRNTFTSPVLV